MSAASASVVMSVSSSSEEIAVLYIPVAGPFAAISTLESEGVGTMALVINGIGQAGGAAMLIAGIAAKKDVFVRSDLVELQIEPLVGPHQTGALLRGRF